MRDLLYTQLSFKCEVTVSVKARKVIVTGPRGTLERTVKPRMDVRQVEDGNIRVDVWHGSRKDTAKITPFVP